MKIKVKDIRPGMRFTMEGREFIAIVSGLPHPKYVCIKSNDVREVGVTYNDISTVCSTFGGRRSVEISEENNEHFLVMFHKYLDGHRFIYEGNWYIKKDDFCLNGCNYNCINLLNGSFYYIFSSDLRPTYVVTEA